MKTANDIFKNRTKNRKSIEVPEWGVTLKLRKLSFDRMMELAKSVQGIEGNNVTYNAEDVVEVIIQCTTDEQGNQFFTEEHKQDLLDEEFDVIIRIFREIMKASGDKTEAEKN